MPSDPGKILTFRRYTPIFTAPRTTGEYLLCRDLGETVEFLTLTYWENLEAVERFTDGDYFPTR